MAHLCKRSILESNHANKKSYCYRKLRYSCLRSPISRITKSSLACKGNTDCELSKSPFFPSEEIYARLFIARLPKMEHYIFVNCGAVTLTKFQLRYPGL